MREEVRRARPGVDAMRRRPAALTALTAASALPADVTSDPPPAATTAAATVAAVADPPRSAAATLIAPGSAA